MIHNLDLYRLRGFSGFRTELLQLHEWLTGGNDLPAIAISGEQGNGKSTLATATAWNHIHDFSDGIVRVSPAGAAPFRLYDVVRTLDANFGTAITRASSERWGVSILEQLYRRRRLIILDKLAGATAGELETLVEIIGHLHESGGNSRFLLIDRNFQPRIAQLVQFQHIQLQGIVAADSPTFIERRAPAAVRHEALQRAAAVFAMSGGRPLSMRLILGLMLDFPWNELEDLLEDFCSEAGVADVHRLAAFAVETLANSHPQVGPLLDRLVTARGGATTEAVRELFWGTLGSGAELNETLATLDERGILELDHLRGRVTMHPVIRRYLEQNAMMLGEEWERRHASFYVTVAGRYMELPLERWSEVDVEWGNIFKAADWCQQRVERIWQRKPMEIVADPAADGVSLPLPAEVQADAEEIRRDLRLTRDTVLAMAHYSFWRHPPGIQAWLAAGAVAALALADHRNYGWFLMNLGRQAFFMGEVDEAVSWLERARAIFDPRDLLAELAYVYADLGTSLRILDQPRRALDYFQASFDCVAQLGDELGLATAYMNLGSAYYSVGNYERALSEQRKAMRIAVRRSDHHRIGSAYNNMGLALEAMDRLDDALRAYEYALQEFLRFDDATGISASYNNLGSVSYARQDYPAAVHWYELDLNLLEQRGAWTDMAATLHNLGHVALEMDDLPRALTSFVQSRDLYAAFELTEYVQEEQEMIDYLQRLSASVQTKR